MSYLPMRDRWATLAFIAVLAIGATMVSLNIDAEGSRDGTLVSEPEESGKPQGESEPGAIPVVNPDGSVRQTPVLSEFSQSSNDEETMSIALPEADPADDGPFPEEDSETSSDPRTFPQGRPGRIE